MLRMMFPKFWDLNVSKIILWPMLSCCLCPSAKDQTATPILIPSYSSKHVSIICGSIKWIWMQNRFWQLSAPFWETWTATRWVICHSVKKQQTLRLDLILLNCSDHNTCDIAQTTSYGFDVERRNVDQIHPPKRIFKVAVDFKEGACHRRHRYARCDISCFGHGILNGEHLLPLECCFRVRWYHILSEC